MPHRTPEAFHKKDLRIEIFAVSLRIQQQPRMDVACDRLGRRLQGFLVQIALLMVGNVAARVISRCFRIQAHQAA